jgi:hypothetical protein
MTATTTPYRSGQQPGRDGFWQLVRSEWTKFRTIRGWLLATVLAIALVAFMPILLAGTAKNSTESCQGGQCQVQGQTIATGPNGEAVTDGFYFVRQPLAGNGSLTAEVAAPVHAGPAPEAPKGFPTPPPTQPWAKAGLIIKASTKPGSAYAAVMLTGSHGARMQYDYTHDIAGIGNGSPLWLRLTRSGDLIEGYNSTDGTHWTLIGKARLANLPTTAVAGMFVASPDFFEASRGAGGGDNGVGGPTIVTASFSHLVAIGRWPAVGHWTGNQVSLPIGGGGPSPVHAKCHQPRCEPGPVSSGYEQTGNTFELRGSGDIAPFVPIVDPVQVSLYGALFGLLVVIALAALFITAEYRRGLIRTTLAANPRRPRVLLAKAIVIGLVSFAVGTIGTAIAYPIVERKLNGLGWTPPVWHIYSLTSAVSLQAVLGTGALVAVTGIIALAGGTIMRRSAGAVTTVIALVVLPLILSIILPLTPAQWMLRLTPAAAFGLQQAAPRYSQVANSCAPYHGCFPLAPWNGFAVMCAWAVLALGLAAYLLHRRDA